MKLKARGPAALLLTASMLLGCDEETWTDQVCERIVECRDFLSPPPEFGDEGDRTCQILVEMNVANVGEQCREAYEARTATDSCEAFSAYRVPEACRDLNLFGRDRPE